MCNLIKTHNNYSPLILSLTAYLERFQFHALVTSICLSNPFPYCARLGDVFSGEHLHGLTPTPPHAIYDASFCRSPNYPGLPTFFPSAQTPVDDRAGFNCRRMTQSVARRRATNLPSCLHSLIAPSRYRRRRIMAKVGGYLVSTSLITLRSSSCIVLHKCISRPAA